MGPEVPLLSGHDREITAEAVHAMRIDVLLLSVILAFATGMFFAVFVAYTEHVVHVADAVSLGIYGAVAYNCGIMVSNPIWGKVADSVGRKPVLLVSVAAIGLAELLLCLNKGALGFMLILGGLGMMDAVGCMWHLMLIDTQHVELSWPFTTFESTEDMEGRFAAMFALIWSVSAAATIFGLGASIILTGAVGIRGTLLVAACIVFVFWFRLFFSLPESLPESKGKGFTYFFETLEAAYADLLRGLTFLLATHYRRMVLLASMLQHATSSMTLLLINYWVAYKYGFGMVMRGVLLIMGIVSVGACLCWLRYTLVPFFRAPESAAAALVAAVFPFWLVLAFSYSAPMAPVGALAFGTLAIFPELRSMLTVDVPLHEQGFLQGTWAATGGVGSVAGPLLANVVFHASTDRGASHDTHRTHDSIQANAIWHLIAAVQVCVACVLLEAQRARQREDLDHLTADLAKDAQLARGSSLTPDGTSSSQHVL